MTIWCVVYKVLRSLDEMCTAAEQNQYPTMTSEERPLDAIRNRDDKFISIGAVWLIPKKTNWYRSFREALVHLLMTFDKMENSTVRVHFGTEQRKDVCRRYFWGKPWRAEGGAAIEGIELWGRGVVIHEDLEVVFVIINKPAGIPVHAYVKNAVNNVAHMYEMDLRE